MRYALPLLALLYLTSCDSADEANDEVPTVAGTYLGSYPAGTPYGTSMNLMESSGGEVSGIVGAHSEFEALFFNYVGTHDHPGLVLEAEDGGGMRTFTGTVSSDGDRIMGRFAWMEADSVMTLTR